MKKHATKLVVLPNNCYIGLKQKGTVKKQLNTRTYFAGGKGTKKEPYLISNASQLSNVRYFLHSDTYFKLINDIDLSFISNWEPIGNDNNVFRGVFDGNQFVIRYLNIKRGTEDYIGLFGHVSEEGVISNVTIGEINITGHNYVGGLVGLNCGTINNCYVVGNIEGHEAVGGLVGYNCVGTIERSFISGSVKGNENVGGMIGNNSVGTIENGLVTAFVKGTNYIGGLVGFSFLGNITGSYATGYAIGSNNAIGSLIGADVGGEIINSYAKVNVTGSINSGGLIGFSSGEV